MADYTLKLSDDEVARYRWMAARAQLSERELWEQAGIRPGARVADVGCGPGAVLTLLAQIVGPEGSVTGVDANEEALAAARAMIATTGVEATARVQQGQADE